MGLCRSSTASTAGFPRARYQLDHLEGYRGSRPVRVGNDAVGQLQLDIYGELLDAVYLYNKYGEPISYDFWVALSGIVDWVCDNWRRVDDGIWESRGGRRHWVYSKLMCWVALDRALRLADKRSFPAPRERWTRVRDEVYQEIMSRGWSAEFGNVHPVVRRSLARRELTDDAARVLRLAE